MFGRLHSLPFRSQPGQRSLDGATLLDHVPGLCRPGRNPRLPSGMVRIAQHRDRPALTWGKDSVAPLNRGGDTSSSMSAAGLPVSS
jgi:hypothetical protein